jgi:hypothetical protein
MNDHETQFVKAVQGTFSTPLGQWLLKELAKRHARPFDKDPYNTAFNLGAQDLIRLLQEITEEP